MASQEMQRNGDTSDMMPDVPGYPVVGYNNSDCHYLQGHRLAKSPCKIKSEQELIATISVHYNRVPTMKGNSLDGHQYRDGNHVAFWFPDPANPQVKWVCKVV